MASMLSSETPVFRMHQASRSSQDPKASGDHRSNNVYLSDFQLPWASSQIWYIHN